MKIITTLIALGLVNYCQACFPYLTNIHNRFHNMVAARLVAAPPTGADFIYGDLVCGRQPWKSVVHDVRKRETRSNRVKRIVEGDHTDYAEWPWQVQMLWKVKSSAQFDCKSAGCEDPDSRKCYGTCIHKYYVNDNNTDCADGSDEDITVECDATRFCCEKEWLFGNGTNGCEGRCKSLGIVDDGRPDCDNGSDEEVTLAEVAEKLKNHLENNPQLDKDNENCPETYRHFCGGSLLNKNWMITAAHCVDTDEVLNTQDDILIRLGEHDTESIDEPHPHVDRKIKDIIIHPKYDRNFYKILTEGYDVALIELDNPVDYALNIIPICLPTDDNKLVGETGWATGFGLISTANFSITGGELPTVLQEIDLSILSNDDCDGGTLPNIMVCAKNSKGSSCMGDSGGPLAVKQEDGSYFIAGITSFGRRNCAKGVPGAYTRVSEVRDWIKQTMEAGLP